MNEKQSTIDDYQKRIRIVEDYIFSHLDEEIDLCRLAEIANFSPYHFHRITRAFLGEPIGAYIAHMRVETAARLLRYTDEDVADIACRVGFGESSSLSRAFRKAFGISPNQYRKSKTLKTMTVSNTKSALTLAVPEITTLAPKHAICIRFNGIYGRIDFCNAIGRLLQKIKADNLYSAGNEYISVYHDDPKVTDADHLRTDVCVTVDKTATPGDGIEVCTVAGGKYAVFTYTGPYDRLGEVYDYIFSAWLPQAAAQIDDRPCFEKYCNDPEKTAPEKMKTQLFVPIK